MDHKLNLSVGTASAIGRKQSAIALIDGEHYLPVIKSALKKISQEYILKAAVFIGGIEKIANENDLKTLDIRVVKEDSAQKSLIKALKEFSPDLVIDLSDEPVLDYKKRFLLASIALKNGIQYRGADFIFQPPKLESILDKPSLAVIGTGKRVGKTAVSAYLNRLLKKQYNPVVIAMGRGGPEEPEILEGDKIKLTPSFLLSESKNGKHAASDYYEDALMSRVTTIGCRRAGGGLAGEPYMSNVGKGAKKANLLSNNLVILEGSGSTIPPVKADKNILVIGAHQRLEDIAGYFGPFRLLLADLIIITMAEEPHATTEKIEKLEKAIRLINKKAPIIKTIFKPKPLGNISNKKVFLATTAKNGLGQIKSHLEEVYDAKVVAISNNLSNRPLLLKAINEAPDFDVLLSELKAAAIDVATEIALDLEKEVVYMDNNPLAIDGTNLDSVLFKLISTLPITS